MSLPTKTTDSPVGNALNINAGIRLLPAAEAATWHDGNWTAALWFKSTTGSSGASDAKILSRDHSEYFSIGLVQSASTNNAQNLIITITTDNGSGSNSYTVLQAVTVNVWHHLAISHDGTTFLVYLDGEEVYSRATYDPNSTPPSRVLAVGANVDSSGVLDNGKFVGAISEVKLFNTAISGAKVRGLYQSPGSTAAAITDTTIKFGSSNQVGNNIKLSAEGLIIGAPSLALAPFSVTPAGAATINSIASTPLNNDITLDPHGAGKLVVKGNSTRGAGQLKLNCEQNTHGITIKGPPHSATANYTLTMPNTDGDADQVLKTDGSGNLDWVAQSSGSVRTVGVDTNGDGSTNNTLESSETLVLKAGSNVTLAETGGVVTINSSGGGSSGISNVVEDTTPQLGGDLDAQDNSIVNVENVFIGGNPSSSSSFDLYVEAAKTSEESDLIRIKNTATGTTTDGRIIAWTSGNNHRGSVGYTDVSYGSGGFFAGAGCGLLATTQFSTPRVQPCNGSGDFRDNQVDLGNSSARFDDIYATNSTIQTSDRNEKQDIEQLTDAERRVAVAAKGLMRKFRWRDAVTEKGDNARIHFGIIAQDLEAAFTAEGLDAGRYAMFISTTWWEHDGTLYEEQEHIPEGVTATQVTRLGIRYPELLAFIIAAI